MPKQSLIGNKYTIVSFLGEGGQAKVYQVSFKENFFALKKYEVKSDDQFKKGLDDFQLVCSVNHKNICSYMSSFMHQEDSSHYLCYLMPFCDKGDLYDHIISNNLDTKTLFDYFYQIGEAIELLHKKMIAHRDIKPQNILLKTEKNEIVPKLADFGYSKKSEDKILEQTLVGTLLFIAPEVCIGSFYSGFQADMFSFGATIYFGLTKSREPLFIKVKDNFQQVQEELEKKSSFKELNDLVINLIHYDPKRRLTASELMDKMKTIKNNMK